MSFIGLVSCKGQESKGLQSYRKTMRILQATMSPNSMGELTEMIAYFWKLLITLFPILSATRAGLKKTAGFGQSFPPLPYPNTLEFVLFSEVWWNHLLGGSRLATYRPRCR